MGERANRKWALCLSMVSEQKKSHRIEVFTLLVQVSLQPMKVSEQKRFPPDKTEL